MWTVPMVKPSAQMPSIWQRIWAASLVGVAQLPMLWLDNKAADEDVLAVVDGGPHKWYPNASRPSRPPRSLWYRVVGAGLGIRGSLSFARTELRFVPASFWRNRGFSDFIVTEPRFDRDGGFLIVGSGDRVEVFRTKFTPAVATPPSA